MSLLRATDLSVRLGDVEVISGLDLDVQGNEMLGIVGPNGAGKTTLLRALAGLVTPAAGSVRLEGRPLGEVARTLRARRLAYLPQGSPIHWPMTVARVVALGRLPHLAAWQRPAAADSDAIARAMEETQVSALGNRSVATLSAGERMRVMLARVLATEPAVVLADEPVAALDPYYQLETMALLGALARRGGGVVVVLHDLNLAVRFCDRLILLDRGRVVAAGVPAEVLAPSNLARAYRIEAMVGSLAQVPYVLPWRTLDGGTADG